MYHSIVFFNSENIERDTWRDWGLIPTSRPVVSPPKKKGKTIDIPGRNGYLDLSTALTGYPVYGNRTGSWDFSFRPPSSKNINLQSGLDVGWDWANMYTHMMEFFNSGIIRVFFDDDPLWYYRGNVYVDEWNSKSDGSGSKITIGYDLEPYKLFYKNTGEGNTQFDLLEPINGPVFERIFYFTFPEAYNYTDSNGKRWHIASAYRFSSSVAEEKKKQSPWNYYGLNSKPQPIKVYWSNRSSNTSIRIVYYYNHKLSTVKKDIIIPSGSTSGSLDLPDCIIGPFSELYFALYSNNVEDYTASCNVCFDFLPGRM